MIRVQYWLVSQLVSAVFSHFWQKWNSTGLRVETAQRGYPLLFGRFHTSLQIQESLGGLYTFRVFDTFGQNHHLHVYRCLSDSLFGSFFATFFQNHFFAVFIPSSVPFLIKPALLCAGSHLTSVPHSPLTSNPRQSPHRCLEWLTRCLHYPTVGLEGNRDGFDWCGNPLRKRGSVLGGWAAPSESGFDKSCDCLQGNSGL